MAFSFFLASIPPIIVFHYEQHLQIPSQEKRGDLKN